MTRIRRILVGRPTRVRLAECTGDFKIVVNQEVWVVSRTFRKVEFSRQLRRNGRNFTECTVDTEILIRPSISAVPSNFWKIELSVTHSQENLFCVVPGWNLKNVLRTSKSSWNRRNDLSPGLSQKLGSPFTDDAEYWLCVLQELVLQNVQESAKWS